MKLKRKPSVNVEYADSFRDRKAPKYKYGSPNNDIVGINKQVEKMMKLDETLPPSKQAQVNRIGSALNRMAKRGTTPTPSPRGEAPKPRDKPKKQKAVTPFPRTHTSNKTMEAMVVGMEKPRGGKPSKYEAYVAPKKPKGAFEEAKAKKDAEDAKKNRGKQSRLRPKYDKKTGKKL